LLGLVILAFVALYFPDFMGDPATAAMRRGVAWVEGEPIQASTFLDRYRNVARMYQEQSGGDFSPALARQLGIPEQVVGELVRSRVLLLEARRLGLQVTNTEVGTSIATSPTFQENGVFIGRDAYLSMLRAARLNPRDFEDSVRSDLLTEKLRLLITESPHVSDLELREEYRRRNENASLDVWFLTADSQRGEVEVTEAEARGRYDAGPEEFEVPEQRRIRYLTLSEQTLAEEVSVRQREIQRYYNRNLFNYQVGEQAEASHILLQAESESDEDATRTLAARLAERARTGEDFAGLARTYSADEATREAGGALGVFGPEEMVPEFSEAVFSMMPGEISDPVRTDYGYHVIRLDRRQAAETRELSEVEGEIETRLRQEKAATLLTERVLELGERTGGADSLDNLTSDYPLWIPQESDFFSAGDSVAGPGSAELSTLAFDLEIGAVGGPIRLPTGYAFVEVLEERPPHVPDFEEIREQVIATLEGEQAKSLVEEAGQTLRDRVAGGQTIDTDPTPLERWFRGSPLGVAGMLPGVEETVFGAAVGEVVGPLEADRGYAVVRINGKEGFSEATFEEQKEPFRAQMAEEKKQRIWAAFVSAAGERYNIRIDRQALNALIG
jgi:peptidyl-prolyl cis-trans isomerase D